MVFGMGTVKLTAPISILPLHDPNDFYLEKLSQGKSHLE
jgi:hypothetical protein